jgi:thermitase
MFIIENSLFKDDPVKKHAPQHLGKHTILTLSLTAAFLASCNSTPALENTTAQNEPLSMVQTIDISGTDTASSIENQYQGKIVTWQPEAGFAVLAVRKPASSLTTAPVTTTPTTSVVIVPAPITNAKVFAIAEGTKATASGTKATASGLVNSLAQDATDWGTGWYGSTLASGAFNSSYHNLNAFVGNGLYMVPFFGGERGGMKLASAQALAPKLGAGIKVAIIDTGVDLEHPGLKGVVGDKAQPPHLAPSTDWMDFVDTDAIPQEVGGDLATGFGHGTGVAGIVLQVAPNAQIMPIRVLGPDGSGDVTNVIKGIEWAVNHGAKIINLSLGSSEPVEAVRKMITWASSKGVFVVASSGNTNDNKVTYPAADAQNDLYGGQRLISVGSVGSGNIAAQFLGFTDAVPTVLDVKSAFSTYGNVEMYAPGELIATLAPNLKAAVWTGTSFAAPMVGGTLALALGQPLTSTQLARVADAITTSSTPIDTLNSLLTGKLGKGRVDAAAFMRKVLK